MVALGLDRTDFASEAAVTEGPAIDSKVKPLTEEVRTSTGRTTVGVSPISVVGAPVPGRPVWTPVVRGRVQEGVGSVCLEITGGRRREGKEDVAPSDTGSVVAPTRRVVIDDGTAKTTETGDVLGTV